MLPFIKKGKTSQDFQNLPPGTLPPFNPANSPNTVALWDGDSGLTLATGWTDVISANNISFLGSGTLPLTGGTLNGHNTVLFNGTNQFGVSGVFSDINQYTIYLVLKQTTWTTNDFLWESDAGLIHLIQNDLSPKLLLEGSAQVFNNQLILNTWGIITCHLNASGGGLRINLNSTVFDSNLVPDPITRFYLACDSGTTNNGNIESAYIIIRNVADSTAIQNNFINWLKNRFAI